MSVSIGVIATVVLHLTIGNVTEQEMAPYVWEMIGLCKAEPEFPRDSCEWSDTTAHCQAREARHLPCDRARYMRGIWRNYGVSPGEIFQ